MFNCIEDILPLTASSFYVSIINFTLLHNIKPSSKLAFKISPKMLPLDRDQQLYILERAQSNKCESIIVMLCPAPAAALL